MWCVKVLYNYRLDLSKGINYYCCKFILSIFIYGV